uniref:Uncharacterized protein n=1 Tax=Xenopus tropicalis TaxID=8364 RepID=A0A1B8Y1Z7_XENTR
MASKQETFARQPSQNGGTWRDSHEITTDPQSPQPEPNSASAKHQSPLNWKKSKPTSRIFLSLTAGCSCHCYSISDDEPESGCDTVTGSPSSDSSGHDSPFKSSFVRDF